ncbi:MAG: hypothetical protein KJ882_00050 [Proteobacteria bacterium]|nr:hypothetical protein [Pseudomonadota bacterium]
MNKAQASLEFTIAFVLTILFLVFTVNLFVWFNHCVVQRQVEFEKSRSRAGGFEGPNKVGDSDFFRPPELNVFVSGGYSAKN